MKNDFFRPRGGGGHGWPPEMRQFQGLELRGLETSKRPQTSDKNLDKHEPNRANGRRHPAKSAADGQPRGLKTSERPQTSDKKSKKHKSRRHKIEPAPLPRRTTTKGHAWDLIVSLRRNGDFGRNHWFFPASRGPGATTIISIK